MNFSTWYRHFAISGPNKWYEWILFLLLLPLGVLYGVVTFLRAYAYRKGLLKSICLDIPVVSVGNLVAGGTGKTPMVDYLLNWCRERGIRAAVLSRGYGGKRTSDVLTVCDGAGLLTGPDEAGDEPCLLARRHPESIVIVASDRGTAGREAIDRYGAELLILDDGYQHLQLDRTLNLLLVDARRPFGNGRVLPAGYLREFPCSIDRADILVLTRSAGLDDLAPPFNGPLVRTNHRPGTELLGLDGSRIPLTEIHGKKAVAFCGIADPGAFFAQLRGVGVELVDVRSYPDHFSYARDFVKDLGRSVDEAEFFLTTEKDGVKLGHLNLPLPCYQVPLEISVLEGEEVLLTSLDNLLCKDKKPMPLSKDLLDILACPQCKGEVHVDAEGSEIVCDQCRIAFPIRDEIPVMLIDEARSL